MAHEGEDHNKEKMEYLQIIRNLFEEMNQNIVFMSQQMTKGFELLASQMGSKGITWDSGSSILEEKKTMGEHIFSQKIPHNRTHELHITKIPNTPKFLTPKEDTNIQFEIDTITKDWAKLDEECRRSIKFEQYFTMAKKFRKKEGNNSL